VSAEERSEKQQQKQQQSNGKSKSVDAKDAKFLRRGRKGKRDLPGFGLGAAVGPDEIADSEVREHEEGCGGEVELQKILAPEGSVIGVRVLEG